MELWKTELDATYFFPLSACAFDFFFFEFIIEAFYDSSSEFECSVSCNRDCWLRLFVISDPEESLSSNKASHLRLSFRFISSGSAEDSSFWKYREGFGLRFPDICCDCWIIASVSSSVDAVNVCFSILLASAKSVKNN